MTPMVSPRFTALTIKKATLPILAVCSLPVITISLTAADNTLPATSSTVPFRVQAPGTENLSPPPPFPADILAKKLPAPPDTGDVPKLDDLRNRLTLLNQFLDLPPEKLCQIRETIAAIEKMSDKDRQSLRVAIDQFFKMHPDTQKTVVSHMQHIDPKDRNLLRQYWFSMTAEQRAAERQKLMGMSPTERAEYDKELLAHLQANPPPSLDSSSPTMPTPPPLPPSLPMAPADTESIPPTSAK